MLTRRRLFLGVTGLLAGSACARSQLEPLTTQALEDERRNSGSPALAAAAVAQGRAAQTWVAGERRVGSGVAVTARDVWHLGSITKSMTATLVARLVEAGAVRWDDTAGELLRDAAPDMQDAYRSVSFRHLSGATTRWVGSRDGTARGGTTAAHPKHTGRRLATLFFPSIYVDVYGW